MVYIVERVLFKGFNGVYRRTCTVQTGLIVYIVERVPFKEFNGVYRRTCTVQRVQLCISPNVYCSKGLIVDIVERVGLKGLIVYIAERVLFKGFNCVYRRTCTVQRV